MTFAEDAVIVLTLVLLEAVLSFDNAAILAAMVRKLPLKDRRKALLYGLVGAYVLRSAAILLAVVLIQNPWLKFVGGGYLIFLAVKHFYQLVRRRDDGADGAPHAINTGFLTRLGVPVLVATIIQIELIDLAFAIDQVLVAVAFTDKVVLIILASMLGILFLRLSAAVLARVMDWLPLLEHMAYVAVFYVGIKLILLHPFFVVGDALAPSGYFEGGDCVVPLIDPQHPPHLARGAEPGCEIPTAFSVSVTLGLFGGPIATKLLLGIPKSSPRPHIAASDTTPPTVVPSMPTLQAAHREAGDIPKATKGGPARLRRGRPPGQA